MTREPQYQLTTTQIGAIGESTAATGLVLASGGRLAPFKPYADDDGIDLLIYDKVSKAVIPLQVKSRTKVDNEIARIITGTRWNGPAFFGLRSRRKKSEGRPPALMAAE